jgi:hypothetical protein
MKDPAKVWLFVAGRRRSRNPPKGGYQVENKKIKVEDMT